MADALFPAVVMAMGCDSVTKSAARSIRSAAPCAASASCWRPSLCVVPTATGRVARRRMQHAPLRCCKLRAMIRLKTIVAAAASAHTSDSQYQSARADACAVPTWKCAARIFAATKAPTTSVSFRVRVHCPHKQTRGRAALRTAPPAPRCRARPGVGGKGGEAPQRARRARVT